MKAAGQGKLCLFMAQSEVEQELNRLQAERIFTKLGLDKSEQKMVQGFSIPLIPKQEDFYLFPFRHISATTVGAHSYKATDFSQDDVLKKSVSLLAGKPAYLNHNQQVGLEVGVVGETEWTPGYKNSKGDKVPGGIEAPFVIDSVLQPELVRKLSSPVSPIDSCSVSTLFEWEASHDFEHDGDFFWHLGEMVDGTMVRRIVNDILSYEESSMVWMGADPYAKMLDEKGHVIDIDKAFAYSRNKFSQDPTLSKYDSGRKYFVFDCLDSKKLLHLTKSSVDFSKAKTENDNNMNKELLDLLASIFGTTSDKIVKGEFTKADAEKIIKSAEAFNALKANAESFERVNTEKVDLSKKVEKLDADIVTLTAEKKTLADSLDLAKPKIAGFDAMVTTAKAEAKRMYGLFSKGKPVKAIEDELESETNLDKLQAKIEMFGGVAIGTFSGTCNKCQSKDISFRSSKHTEDEGQDDASEDLNMARLAHE